MWFGPNVEFFTSGPIFVPLIDDLRHFVYVFFKDFATRWEKKEFLYIRIDVDC